MNKSFLIISTIMFHLFFLCMTLSFSGTLPDMDYIPRLLTASFFLIPFSVLVFFLIRKDNFKLHKPVFVNTIVGCTLLLTAVVFKSYFASLNAGDSLFELLKYVVAFLYLCLFGFLFFKMENPLQLIARSIQLPFVIILLVGVWQLFILITTAQKNNEPLVIAYQLASLLSNKNSFAEFLLLCLPMILYISLKDSGIWRFIAIINLVVSCSFIFMLKSFSVFLAIALTITIIMGMILWTHKKKISSRLKFSSVQYKATLISILIIIFSSAFYFLNKTDGFQKASIAARYVSGKTVSEEFNNNSVFERLLLWRNSARMIKEEMINGVGLGNWKIFFPKYGYVGAQYLATDSVKFTRAHNDFLQLFAETGIVGFMSFCLLLFIALFYAVRNYFITKETKWLVNVSALCCFLIIAMFGFPTEKILIFMLLFVYLSLLVSNLAKQKNNIRIKFTFIKTALLFLLLPVCLALFSVTVCYARIKEEIIFKQILTFKEQYNWQRMYRLTQQTKTKYLTLDYTATPVAWYKGTASYMNNNMAEAMQYYMMAKEQAPYHVQIYNDIGAVYLNTGDNNNAEVYFTKALTINPYFPDAHFNRAVAVFNTGNKYGAYQQFREVSKIHRPAKYQDYMLTVVNAIADSVFTSRNIDLNKRVYKEDIRGKSYVYQIEVKAYSKGIDFLTELDKEILLYNNQ